jgi:hypothetical protein
MTTADEPITVEVDDPGSGVAVMLDDATARILELEARGYRVRRLRVSRDAYERIAGIHARDVERGVPLIVLGLPLVAAET